MFRELLENPNRIEPGPLQAAARKRFPGVVRRSHLDYFCMSQHPPYSGKYILIGVASYSPDELQLLDAVDAAYPAWRGTAKVAVFDLTECKDPRGVLAHYSPPPPYPPPVPLSFNSVQSPIVGIWDGAARMALVTGLYDAQKLLRNERFLK
jgi:hypothetical protein